MTNKHHDDHHPHLLRRGSPPVHVGGQLASLGWSTGPTLPSPGDADVDFDVDRDNNMLVSSV